MTKVLSRYEHNFGKDLIIQRSIETQRHNQAELKIILLISMT